MSLTVAGRDAARLAHHLEATGLRVSIELVQGRGGSGWHDDRFVGTMGHHIASRRTQGLTPFLTLVKRGRSDLAGPLCNGYLGFDGVARIICMGWANHPGAGGPYKVELGTVPRNNGRPYFFGWEHEGGLRLADWTPEMRRNMGRCHAGTLNWLSEKRGRVLTERSHIEHFTWAPGRKVDRAGYTLGSARDELRPYLKGNTVADHRHVPMPDALPRDWANGDWEDWVEFSKTDPDSRTWDFYREDMGWVYSRVIAPMLRDIARLEGSVRELEGEVQRLRSQVGSGGGTGGIPFGSTVRLERP